MSAIAADSVYGKAYTASENYERYFVPLIGGPFAEDLVTAALLRPGERVLDVACGTGVVARLAAKAVGAAGTVAGLDINAAMLDVARRSATQAGAAIRFYETSAESMPLPNEQFDVVFCQLGLQFVADKAAVLREMHRVLVSGGRLLISVPPPNAFFDSLDTALGRHVRQAAGFVRAVFSLNDANELQRLVSSAGLIDVNVRSYSKVLDLPRPKDFLWQYIESTPMIGMIAGIERPVIDALEQDVVRAWRPWLHGETMRYEQGMLVASARK